MKTILDIGILLINVLIMIAVGMDLDGRQFATVARQKVKLILVLVTPTLVLPALALYLSRLMHLPAYLTGGILLLAACPVGDIANLYALLARSNVALCVTVNTLSCLLSTITMAIIFLAYDKLLSGQFIFAVPAGTVIVRLTLMIVLPVLTGMCLRRFQPRFAAAYGRSFRNVSIGGLVCLLVYVLISQRAQIAADWQQTAIAGAAFMVLAMFFGLALGWLLRVPPGDIATIGILFAVRNVALATVISITLLNRVEYAGFATVYFLTEVPILLGAVTVFRSRWFPAPR
jgi:BASS family bile acid:Na+ symporter